GRRNANFWENIAFDGFLEYGNWDALNDADIEFMTSITNLKNGGNCERRYFVDLTDQTVSNSVTIPFIKAERQDWSRYMNRREYKKEHGVAWWEWNEGLEAIHDKYKYEGSGSSWNEINQQMANAGFADGALKLIDSVTKEIVYYEKINPWTIIEVHDFVTMETYEKIDYEIVMSAFDYTPLVLDLDKNNKIDTANNDWLPHAPKFYMIFAKYFDMTGDGAKDFTEWVSISPKDGILAMPDENGNVESALQLFGNAGGYLDGFEKLSMVCDTDNNGYVENEELEGLKLWVDENSDAVCQADELHELSEYNITRIGTSHDDYVSSYVTADGNSHTVWDWWPATYQVRKFRR
ncbi:MAG: hypothetical protein ACLFQV_12120, partial [Vulcanimicrobiota bacterium]